MTISDMSARQIGYILDGRIHNMSARQVGYVLQGKVFNMSARQVGYFSGNDDGLAGGAAFLLGLLE